MNDENAHKPKIEFNPIGIIHSPYKDSVGIPRQAAGVRDVTGEIELYPDYEPGLEDLEEFSHIVVVFYLHLVRSLSLKASPPWDNKQHGVFATRSPYRPNPIGISIVKLGKIRGNRLFIKGIDMADQTPVLDIKPYVPSLNPTDSVRTGWLENKVDRMTKSKSGDR